MVYQGKVDTYAVFLQVHKPKSMISGLVTAIGRGTTVSMATRASGNTRKASSPSRK